MLDKLSPDQVERAFQFLADPSQKLSKPPQELQNLNQLEWFLLGRMLTHLLEEKDHHPLQ